MMIELKGGLKKMMVEYKVTEKLGKEIIDELLNIQQEKGLTPEQIVEKATDEKSPLHCLFEWEDSTAAYKWRLQQARVLVNEVKVIIEEKEYYAFENVAVSVSASGKSGGGQTMASTKREYVPVVQILNDEDLRKQIIRSALNHLSYWEQQNSKYSELAPIITVAKRLRKKINKEWQKKKK